MISSTNCYFLKPFTRLPHQWRGSYLQQFEYCIYHLLFTTLHIQIGNIKYLCNMLKLFVKGFKASGSSYGQTPAYPPGLKSQRRGTRVLWYQAIPTRLKTVPPSSYESMQTSVNMKLIQSSLMRACKLPSI